MEEGHRAPEDQQGEQDPLPETSEIKRLDDDTVRRITAEQAISDLASIVKELVDNALDAESTTIKIRLFGQGLDIIEVSDDGNGVPVGSRPYMATRHATSKIESLEDIYEGTGLTMGFRGEALFAMACVSDSLVVASRTEDDELATKIVFGKDGRPTNINSGGYEYGQQMARKVGSTVAVVKPFGNLPARRADLVRRIKQERTRIFKLVESYGIFNVGVCFRLIDIHNNREDVALATSASSTKLQETASTLLGPSFLKGTTSLEICLESFFRQKQAKEAGANDDSDGCGDDDICYNWGIRGLISVDPSLAAVTAQQQKRPQRRTSAIKTKPTGGQARARIVQYYSINGRVVELPKVTALLKRLWLAFSSSMGLKQKKPSAILELTLPNNAFDINLSPDKKTVLLTHEEDLLGVIEEHVTKMWSDESSNVFVDGGLSLSQLQQKDVNRSATVGGGDGPNDNTFGDNDDVANENEGEDQSRESNHDYEYDEDDRHKHKRRFAFVRDISKAKMQHEMAERRGTDNNARNVASEIDIHAEEEQRSLKLKQTKLSPVVVMKRNDLNSTQSTTAEHTKMTRDASKEENQPPPAKRAKPLTQVDGGAEKSSSPTHEENQPPPAKKAKPFPHDGSEAEMSSSPTHEESQPPPAKEAKPLPHDGSRVERTSFPTPPRSEKEEDSPELPSPEDRVSDLDRRKWTEIQSKFSRDHDGDKELSNSNLSGSVSVVRSQHEASAIATPTQAPITPEDSIIEPLPSAVDTATSLSRPRRGNLQQFAFQSSTPKSSDGDTSNGSRRITRTSSPLPDVTPPPPNDEKSCQENSNENKTIKSNRKRKERNEVEAIPLPLADRENNRISKELEQADIDLKTDTKDSKISSDEQPSTQLVWRSFSSTEDICLSARVERLNMRKRKRDIDEIRRSIRFDQSGANTIKTEKTRRRNPISGNQGISEDDIDKEVAFDDEGGSNDQSTFIRMPKSTFRSGMQVIGQFNLGFILARCSRNHLWILDQHACDEKYNYEQLCKKTAMHVQPLIRPLPLELTPSEEACVLDHMDIFEANGFKFSFDDQAPIRHRLSLTSLPHSGAQGGRKAVQFGPTDVSALCSILTEGSSYDAGSGGTGTDGTGIYGNNAVRRHAGTGAAVSDDRSDRLLARLPKAIAMFASRACRTSIMIGTALSHKEMNSIVQKLAKVDMPWNCPHGRPTMRHVANVLPMVLKDERRAAEHIAVPTITVVPPTQEEQPEN